MTLEEYMASDDQNVLWRLAAGDVQNLLDEAVDRLTATDREPPAELRSLDDWIALLRYRRQQAKHAISRKPADWELLDDLQDVLTDVEADIRRACRILNKLTTRANPQPEESTNADR